MQQQSIEVCLDVGGTGCKISAKREKDKQLFPFIKFQTKQLFSSKKLFGEKVSKAILQVLKKYSLPSSISIIAISQSGDIDHEKNILNLSYILNKAQSTGHPYDQFDIAHFIRKNMQTLIGHKPKVVLLNDSIGGCLDPSFQDRLVLTLTLGTYPVIGLSEKHKTYTKVYYTAIRNWVDIIKLSDDWNITNSLNKFYIDYRSESQNCKLIREAIQKIIGHYKSYFKWKPDCFVIMGGNARFLKIEKDLPKLIDGVKIIYLLNYQEAIKSQMKGTLNYAKNKSAFKII